MKAMVNSRMLYYVRRAGIMLTIVALIMGIVGCGPSLVVRYDLSISSTDGGAVTVPGEGDHGPYDAGTVVNLVAEPDEGYRFVNWTGDVGTVAGAEAAETTITMDGDYSITANFAIEALEIRTWHDLDSIRDNLSGSYALMNDLDSTADGYAELAGMTANGGRGWEPIGGIEFDPWTQDFEVFDPFVGVLDGQGYEIRDLYVNRPDEDGVGLFGAVVGLVDNVGIAGAAVTGGMGVGALVGANTGSISFSYSTGSVSGEGGVGGLAGGNGLEGTLSNSYSNAAVTGDMGVGGLAGGNVWGSAIVDCYSTGSVTGDLFAGGLVGINDGSTIASSFSMGSVAGVEDVGGLVGATFDGGTVSDSFWDVEASGMVVSAAGTGKTTAEMISIATFAAAMWEITAVAFGDTDDAYTWNIVDGESYPFLSWEEPRDEDESVYFACPNLEAAVREAIGIPTGPIYPSDLEGLTSLEAEERGISDLTGLDYCINLEVLLLDENQITSISPLASLTKLTMLGLSSNQIVDISPLLDNDGLGPGDVIDLSGNPLSADSIYTYIPELMGRGVTVIYDIVTLWPDSITIEREPNRTTAVLKLQAGEYDVYAHTLDDQALFDIVDDDPDLWYKSSIGWFNTLRINPYGPEFTTGMVNPFYLFDFPEGVRTMNEVLNKFVDRDFIASNIMGGLAWPRFTSQHTQLSDYARYYESIAALEDLYEYDPVTGMAWLNDTMAAINDLTDGEITGSAAEGWRYNGDPIPMVVAIRSDDPFRDEIGDYLVAQLRDMGFDATAFKGDMAATLSGLVNVDPEIRGGGWSMYTGGWVSNVLSRDESYWFMYFHTSLWQAGIPAFAHLDVPQDFWDAAFDLWWLNYTSFDARDALYEICLPEHMKYGKFYLVDTQGFSPLRQNVNLAADKAGGILGSWMWALTAHFRDNTGNPQMGGHMRVAIHDLLVEPWNPIAGSYTIYDMFPIRATGDMGTHPDTRDGLRWAGRIDRAEVTVKRGLPAIATNPWVTLDFADTITAPSDAWRAWDWETQSVVTVADALANPDEPWGLAFADVARYSVAYYPADIWDHPLHDGSTLSFADFLYGWILTYDRAQGEGVNPMFDAAAKAAISSTYRDTIGIKFHVNPEPGVGLKVETWSQLWEMDAECMVDTGYPNYAQGNGFWHTIALGVRGERDGEMAFGDIKARTLPLGWINFLNRDVQKGALVGYLDSIRAATTYSDATVPYYEFISAQYGDAGLGSFAAEVDVRMDNLKDFIDVKNHLWVGSGPYYLEDYSYVFSWVRLEAFEDYPDPRDRWLFLLEPLP